MVMLSGMRQANPNKQIYPPFYYVKWGKYYSKFLKDFTDERRCGCKVEIHYRLFLACLCGKTDREDHRRREIR